MSEPRHPLDYRCASCGANTVYAGGQLICHVCGGPFLIVSQHEAPGAAPSAAMESAINAFIDHHPNAACVKCLTRVYQAGVIDAAAAFPVLPDEQRCDCGAPLAEHGGLNDDCPI